MIKKIKGIIIKEIDYKETSKIISLFSYDLGIINIIAKGTKNLKSKTFGATSLITYGNFHITYKEKGLSNLMDVDIINNFKNIKKDIIKISYATYLIDLVNQVYKHTSNSDIYELFKNSLVKIEEEYDPLVICNILELKLLSFLGILPILDKCVECGKTTDIVTISSYKGGYVCKNCFTSDTIVNSKTIKLIRMFYYVDIGKITNIDISDNIKKEINNFIDDYYERYAGLYLKSKTFLKNLEKIK